MVIANCPVCKCTRFKKLFTDINRRDGLRCSGTYVRCLRCSAVFLGERPPWEEIVKYYSSRDPLHMTNPGMRALEEIVLQDKKDPPRWRRFMRKIRFTPHSWPEENVSGSKVRLLDLGCGDGTKLIEFAERGYEVWGVDVSGDGIELCRKVMPSGNFIESDLESIDLPNAHFDYIRIDNVLEHLPDPRRVITECYRMLKKRGKLFIYVPHAKSISFLLMRGNSISSWIPFHLQLFTKKSLCYVMKKAGFSDTKVYGYYPISWLPLSICQWKSKKNETAVPIIPSWLTIACYPFGVAAKALGLAEELVCVGVKN
jgi:ubiquinone/menaquinone biosynthesis C-methylase UbiE